LIRIHALCFVCIQDGLWGGPFARSPSLAHIRRPSPCDNFSTGNGVRKIFELRPVTYQNSDSTYSIASINDTRLMRPYTCTYNVTGVMQLRRPITGACHAQHKRCAATAASRHLNCDTTARLCHVQQRATRKGSNRVRRRGMAHHLVVRRGQPARSTSLRTATKSGCPSVQTGCAQQSADEETCAGHTLAGRRRRRDDSAKRLNRHQKSDQTGL